MRQRFSMIAMGLVLALAGNGILGGCSGDDGSKETDAKEDVAGDLVGDLQGDSGSSDLESDLGPDVEVPKGISRLSADGTKIVDEDGNTVTLRGVNLGAWMFHETWISQVGFTTAGRAYYLAKEMGILEDVAAVAAEVGHGYGTDVAVTFVCPGDGPMWLEKFGPALEAKIGADAAAEFLAELAKLEIQCDDSDRKFRLTLAERFGADKRDELLDTFQRAWLKEADIAWLAEQGFTVVRVPIGYRSLMTGADADIPEKLNWNQAALDRLVELVGWCEKHGIWAVIDIQEAPGGQNTYGTEAALYGNPAMQELTIELWKKLSETFKDSDAVAAYSLLAEPYGAPTEEARDEMYGRLVKAIRAGGDDHLLVIHDGFMGMESLPDPAKYGWTNVIYSTHLFEWNAKNLNAYTILKTLYDGSFSKAQETQKVPYYIGSFSTLYNESWAHEAAELMVGWYEEKGWSWSLWTYKRVEDFPGFELFGVKSSWGLRSTYLGEVRHPDPDLDDFEQFKAAMQSYEQLDFQPDEGLLKALTSWK